MSAQRTVVRVRCRWCGTIRIRPERIRILLCQTDTTYAFTCGCGRPTVHRAPRHVVAALRRLGCVEQQIVLPPRVSSTAPPITSDELLDMHLALHAPGWEHELFA